jgi:hypothetical protein
MVRAALLHSVSTGDCGADSTAHGLRRLRQGPDLKDAVPARARGDGL